MYFKKGKFKQLQQIIAATAFCSYNLESRIHPVNSLSMPNANVYIKRDDELSCTIAGSKLRKYATLIPFLQSKGIQQAVVVGGAYSNNVIGLSQLLIENHIQPVLFLRKPGNNKVTGNLLLTKLLVADEFIHWIDRRDWSDVDKEVDKFVDTQNLSSIKTIAIPEGAFLPSSFYGALTLSMDIIRNEEKEGLAFDHIFVDAGTGLQAIALMIAHAWCQHPAQIHCVLLAVDRAEFETKLEHLRHIFLNFIGEKTLPPPNYNLYVPVVAPSFGSVNNKIINFIGAFARSDGVLLDPIYSGKLVNEASAIIRSKCLKGNILMIHSGGAMSLLGFQESLQKNNSNRI